MDWSNCTRTAVTAVTLVKALSMGGGGGGGISICTTAEAEVEVLLVLPIRWPSPASLVLPHPVERIKSAGSGISMKMLLLPLNGVAGYSH